MGWQLQIHRSGCPHYTHPSKQLYKYMYIVCGSACRSQVMSSGNLLPCATWAQAGSSWFAHPSVSQSVCQLYGGRNLQILLEKLVIMYKHNVDDINRHPLSSVSPIAARRHSFVAFPAVSVLLPLTPPKVALGGRRCILCNPTCLCRVSWESTVYENSICELSCYQSSSGYMHVTSCVQASCATTCTHSSDSTGYDICFPNASLLMANQLW